MTEGVGASDEPELPSFNAFVDGRVDGEKLTELLGLPEGSHLEFKSEIDVDSTEGKVKFAKDVVAMSNTPPGGYILVGVADDGKLCVPAGCFDRSRYDSARLGDIVRGYVDGHVDLRVQINLCGQDDQHEVVVISVHPHPDGLPVPMRKPGNYPDPKNPKEQVSLFKPGEIPVREGAANVPLRHVHWPRILSEYTRRVRAEGTEMAQELLRAFLEDRAQTRDKDPPQGRPRTEVPLLLDMAEDTFTQAVQVALESDRGDVRIRRFLRTAANSLTSKAGDDKFRSALNKWTICSAQALDAGRTDLVVAAIGVLHEAYSQLWIDIEDSRRRLDVVVHLYALGSMAVRVRDWSVVHALALQRVPSNAAELTYVYSSWIRHGQVMASRANLIPEDRGGFLISAARELLVEHPAMRPDVDNDEIPPANELAPDDRLLNSLAQFDIAYCVVVAAEGRDRGGYYPSSAALNDHRAAPITERIATDPDVRRALFPDSDDTVIAKALADVYHHTERESTRYGRWWDVPAAVTSFVRQQTG